MIKNSAIMEGYVMTKKSKVWFLIWSLVFLLLFFVLDDHSLLFLGFLSVALSIIVLIFGIIKREWVYILISSLMSLPTVYFFQLYNMELLKLLWFIPLLLLIIAFIFWWSKMGLSER